jgi:hypothetical protein
MTPALDQTARSELLLLSAHVGSGEWHGLALSDRLAIVGAAVLAVGLGDDLRQRVVAVIDGEGR